MKSKETGDRDGLAVVGLDIGRDTFHLVGFDGTGQVALRKQVKRLSLKATFEKLPRCVVGMEACMSAHFVSLALRDLRFEPRIIPAIYVKPFIKGQKPRGPSLPDRHAGLEKHHRNQRGNEQGCGGSKRGT
ncbi:ISSpo1, transposase [Roseivivax marinus]|uniref:ISSpo1, transposase n=1 Tax=Roseivivax marinus TaxID=1379903 RepID=W4HEF8_9RHOB|nr:ISSpo1, transposase [Roseivivax marinus]